MVEKRYRVASGPPATVSRCDEPVIRLHDTASRTVPRARTRASRARWACTCVVPTVYGPPHLGHGRFSLVFDVLRRYLEWSGLEVRYISNITDIDDNIIDRANREGRAAEEVAIKCEARLVRGDGRDQRQASDGRSPCDLLRGRHGRPHPGARRSRQRLRHQRRRVPLASRPSRTMACSRDQSLEDMRAGGGERSTRGRGEAVTRRLRALEAGEARRAVLGRRPGARAGPAGTPSAS